MLLPACAAATPAPLYPRNPNLTWPTLGSTGPGWVTGRLSRISRRFGRGFGTEPSSSATQGELGKGSWDLQAVLTV